MAVVRVKVTVAVVDIVAVGVDVVVVVVVAAKLEAHPADTVTLFVVVGPPLGSLKLPSLGHEEIEGVGEEQRLELASLAAAFCLLLCLP